MEHTQKIKMPKKTLKNKLLELGLLGGAALTGIVGGGCSNAIIPVEGYDFLRKPSNYTEIKEEVKDKNVQYKIPVKKLGHGYEKHEEKLKKDINKDGKISFEELLICDKNDTRLSLINKFEDKNNDGLISPDEILGLDYKLENRKFDLNNEEIYGILTIPNNFSKEQIPVKLSKLSKLKGNYNFKISMPAFKDAFLIPISELIKEKWQGESGEYSIGISFYNGSYGIFQKITFDVMDNQNNLENISKKETR